MEEFYIDESMEKKRYNFQVPDFGTYDLVFEPGVLYEAKIYEDELQTIIEFPKLAARLIISTATAGSSCLDVPMKLECLRFNRDTVYDAINKVLPDFKILNGR